MPLPRPNLMQSAIGVTVIGPQVASSARFPAPIGGWNQYDSLAAMEPIYALQLDNMFPTTYECRVRKGYTSYATGMSGQVETLFQYGGPSGSKLLAANAGKIYNISSGGAVGAALASGYSSNRWQYVNIGTPGGEFVFACNGTDSPWTYDGTSISTPSLTGVTGSTLVNVWDFKNRLFFCINNSLSFGYLPIQSISGTVSTFDLSAQFPLGGYLIAGGTWSRAGLTEQDDLCVFLTSKGEFAVYQGDDPSSALSWALVNRGRIGSPVGRRCMQKIGSDLYIICQDGLVALSQVLWLDRVDTSKTISQKIGTAVQDAVATYSGNFGWQPFLYPKGNMAFVNVPLSEGATIQQYVVNTATGAWCRFTGLNANCWELYNDAPYFGGTDGKVYKWDTGTTDNGGAIAWEARSAFLNMGLPGQNKQWTLYRPYFRSDDAPTVQQVLEVDYETRVPQPASASVSSASDWDTALWDTAPWTDGLAVRASWGGAGGIGRVCAIHMKGSTNAVTFAWVATDFQFSEAGLI